jgi:hypothetical protein
MTLSWGHVLVEIEGAKSKNKKVDFNTGSPPIAAQEWISRCVATARRRSFQMMVADDVGTVCMYLRRIIIL